MIALYDLVTVEFSQKNDIISIVDLNNVIKQNTF